MTTFTVLLEQPALPHHLPFLHAQGEGHFEERDLDVSITPPDSYDGDLSPLYGGEAHFALTTPVQLVAEYLRGRPVTGIARLFRTQRGVLYRQEALSEVSQLGDRHRACVNGVSTELASLLLETLVEERESTGYEAPQFQHHADVEPVDLIDRGEADLMVIAGLDPEGIRLQQRNENVGFWFFSDFGLPSTQDLILVSTNSLLEDHPNRVQAFVHVLHDSLTAVKNDQDTAARVYRRDYPERAEREDIGALLETSLTKLTPIFSQDASAYTDWGDLLSDEERLGGFLDLDRLIDERFQPMEAIQI